MKDIDISLKEKSIEAFLLAIEIYNKPTIKYRVEGFSFFIVNAWELMLKSYLVKRDGESAIYYKDNPERTITLENCIKKIFTNDKDPLRLNLEKIIELRNTSTHFITPEYEFIYVPLFQACVENFSQKLQELLEEDIVDHIPENFLTLPVSISSLREDQIKAKYSDAVSARLIELNNKIKKLQEDNGSRFSICVTHNHYLTKKKGQATNEIRVVPNAETAVMIIKDIKDPGNTHPYTAKNAMQKLNDMLKRNGVQLQFRGRIIEVNNTHFLNLCKQFGIKDETKFCYTNRIYKHPQYSYSQAAVEYLFKILSENPSEILDALADKFKRNKGRR